MLMMLKDAEIIECVGAPQLLIILGLQDFSPCQGPF
jgi:hypothetical protein